MLDGYSLVPSFKYFFSSGSKRPRVVVKALECPPSTAKIYSFHVLSLQELGLLPSSSAMSGQRNHVFSARHNSCVLHPFGGQNNSWKGAL